MRSLPTAESSEQAMAGACIFEPVIVDEFRDIGLPMFTDPTMGQIVEAVRDLRDAGQAIDNKIVITELGRRGVDLKAVISELLDCGTTQVPHVDYHAKQIRDAYQRRNVIKAAQDAIVAASDPLIEIQKVADSAVAKLESHSAQQESYTFDCEEVSQRLYQEVFEQSERSRCVKTGFPVIDEKLGGGFYCGQSIILAGVTGSGKSTAALNIAENVAVAGQTVLFVSLEMSELEMGERIVARKTGLTIDEQRQNLVGEKAKSMKQGLAYVAMLSDRLKFHTPPATTVSKVRAEARMIAARGGLDLIVVDYLQLLTPEGRHPNKNSEVTQISRSLKVLASEMKVPVLTLSQFNRNVGDQAPEPRHLRDSGSIEQDANTICFVHHGDKSKPCVRQFIVAKNRNGPKCQLNLSYDPPRFLFEDPTTEWVA